MTVKIQVIIAIIVIIALSIIVNMIRKKRLELRYALAWLIVGVGTLVLDCFPKLIKWISDLVGIAAGVVRMNWIKYLFSAALGKTLKFLLAVIGVYYVLPLLLPYINGPGHVIIEKFLEQFGVVR